MSPEQLQEEWRQMAPNWIRESRQGPNIHRTALVDPHILEAVGDVRGKTILDSGCGEGRFCRMLMQRGASQTLGLDLCEPMIAAAKEIAGPNEKYEVADAEKLDFLPAGHFDLAVSYLNQCDLVDYESNTRGIYRALKPGGRFIIANLHPMASATGLWHRDSAGGKLHFIVDNYVASGVRQWAIYGVTITNFHRSLQTYLDSYFAAGFMLERIIEPCSSEGDIARYPELADEKRRPNFIIFSLRKPSAI